MGLDISVVTITAAATWGLAVGTVVLLWWRTPGLSATQQRERGPDASGAIRFPRVSSAVGKGSRIDCSPGADDITNLEVAAFFELIGSLTHARVLDRYLVWEAFGTWINGYYYALRNPVDVIGRARTALEDPLIMHEYEWLYGLVQQMDRKMMDAEADMAEATRDESTALLRREAELEPD